MKFPRYQIADLTKVPLAKVEEMVKTLPEREHEDPHQRNQGIMQYNYSFKDVTVISDKEKEEETGGLQQQPHHQED